MHCAIVDCIVFRMSLYIMQIQEKQIKKNSRPVAGCGKCCDRQLPAPDLKVYVVSHCRRLLSIELKIQK
jgi:hypothetical protein